MLTFVLGTLFRIVNAVLGLYSLLVLVHFILKLVKAPSNKWTNLLASFAEPALAPIRALLNGFLPKKWQIIDWSPVALLILISVVQGVLGIIWGILL